MKPLPSVNLIEVMHSEHTLFKRKIVLTAEQIETAIIRHYMGEPFWKIAEDFTRQGIKISDRNLYAHVYRYYKKHELIREKYGTRAQKKHAFEQSYKQARDDMMDQMKKSRTTPPKKEKAAVEKVVRPNWGINSRLTPELVHEIRHRAQHETLGAIRKALAGRGVQMTVGGLRNIVKKRTWKNLP